MHFAEIVTLIAGAILFTVSFFMPDKGGKASLSEEEERKIIRELLDKEIDGAKFKIEEAAEDCVNDNKDRMERALDRITNEKMSAVDEYSNTVLDQIHKNHDEVMFLYDMLNNKHAQVKNTAAELNQITKSAKVAVKEQSDAAEAAAVTSASTSPAVNPTPVTTSSVASASAAMEMPKLSKPASLTKAEAEEDKQPEQPVTPRKPSAEELSIFEELPANKVELELLEIDGAIKEKPATKKKAPKPKVEKIPVADANIDLMFASDNNSANSNDKILELHKAGKSNMAIAKELGLGIGEVKLVIDLFEGI